MKIYVTGTRGIPGIPGGVERHCEQLYPRISAADDQVEIAVARRSVYIRRGRDSYAGVTLRDVYSPRLSSIEAIVHTLLAVLDAKRWGADIVHIHAIGPSIFAPLARLLGIKVVVTNHGADYEREKWGLVARSVLRFGEYMGCRFANEMISISMPIKRHLAKTYSRESHLIFNGVPIPSRSEHTSFIESLGLSPGKYILMVGRLVPEKGVGDLLDAFERLDGDTKLLVVGDSDHQDAYSTSIKTRMAQTRGVVSPGYLYGDSLNEAFSHAAAFVLPSYHEGLPIALLEALSFGLPVIASDIPANLAVNLAAESYYPTGNTAALAIKLSDLLHREWSAEDRESSIEHVRRNYDWDMIARQTLLVYQTL